MIETINEIALLLWNIVSVIGAIILLWALWRIIQIVRNLSEYGNDIIGFLRGEIYQKAKKHKIVVMKPHQKKRINSILWEGREDEFNEVGDK